MTSDHNIIIVTRVEFHVGAAAVHSRAAASSPVARARVIHIIIIKGWFFILMGVFQRKRRRERQRTHKFWVREISQKREFRYFAVGNAVHPGIVAVAEWFPHDRCGSLRSLRSLR